MNIDVLAEKCHKDAKELGWYEKEFKKSDVESLMMVVTELTEAVEEIRKGYQADTFYRKNDQGKPEGFSVELADAVIRLLDLANYHGIALEPIILEKLEYNKTRGKRHGKNF